MYTIQDYRRPDTLQDAYALLTSNRRNRLLGGTTFLRITNLKIQCAIDLSGLGLDYLMQDGAGAVHIGAMCPLRAVETSPVIAAYAGGLILRAVSEIVGVQFRSAATVGATVFSRYGFSDLIPPLLACGASVVLFHQGELPLADFLAQPRTRDILTEVVLPASPGPGGFLSLRNSRSDLAVLNAAACHTPSGVRIAVGARPGTAALAHGAGLFAQAHWAQACKFWVSEAARLAAGELCFSSNMRGSAAYRRALCAALVSRLLTAVKHAEEVHEV